MLISSRSQRAMRLLVGLTSGFMLVSAFPAAAISSPVNASVRGGPGGHQPGRVLFDIGVRGNVTQAKAVAAAAASSTFPQYEANVRVGSASYPYVIAGKNPAVKVSNASSTIKTDLVPVIIKFANGDTWNPSKIDGCDSGASALSRVQKSPIFIRQSWKWGGTLIGTGQVTDAYQRADFWKYASPRGINPSYGVSLSLTTLKPVTINVPNADKKTSAISCGNHLLGKVNINWLDSHLRSTVLPSLAGQGVGPSVLPVFLLHNVVEYDSSECCVFGYHNAYSTGGHIQTYAVSLYDNSKAFSGSSDVSPLSHELGEWQNNPYTINSAPAWGHVGQVAGCQGNLEVGDPLSGTTFSDKVRGFTYHLQELAFFSWFYYQKPSLGVNDWYSDQGKFKTTAIPCWTATKAPLPTNAARTNQSAGVGPVACPATTSCVAAGSYTDNSGDTQGLLESGSGRSWTATEAPLPPGAAAQPLADIGIVACATASICVAVGSYYDSSINRHVFLLTGSRTSWSPVKMPLPGDAAASPQAVIANVACPSATMCVGAGDYSTSSGDNEGMLITGSGTSWSPVKLPLPGDAAANPQVVVEDLTCPSTARCIAVGSYDDSSGNTQGLLVTRSGTSWVATEAPLPPNAGSIPFGVRISSVACPSTTTCVAAGHYRDSSGNFYGLLLTGSGPSWTPAEAPLPARASFTPVGLASVACTSTSSCVVTGYSHDSAGNYHGMMLTGSGKSWTAAEAPVPTGGSFAVVGSLDCPSTGTCVVTGYYHDASNHIQGLLLTGSGTSWIAKEAPLPAGAAANPGALLGAVACPVTTVCVVASSYNDSSGNTQAVLLTGPG